MNEQKPVAWMSPNKERLEFSRADTVYGSHTIPLYNHPAPSLVKQLVDALEKITQVDAGSPVKTYQEMEDIAKAALKSAKEAEL